jgi:hypothetical protein
MDGRHFEKLELKMKFRFEKKRPAAPFELQIYLIKPSAVFPNLVRLSFSILVGLKTAYHAPFFPDHDKKKNPEPNLTENMTFGKTLVYCTVHCTVHEVCKQYRKLFLEIFKFYV